MSRPSRQALAWLFALGLLLALSLASLMVGAGDMHWSVLWSRSEDDLASQVLVYSRVPRTLALLLAGASMAVCGLLMQMLARNHFVEPSTVGTVESASLGMLAALVGLWQLAAHLELVSPVFFPIVAKDNAGLRVMLRSTISEEQVLSMCELLRGCIES